jgi:ribose transport system permease protein
MSADNTLSEVIDQRTNRGFIAWLVTRQVFWIFCATVAAVLLLSIFTTTFDKPQNIFNVTRNFSFVGIIAIAMTVVIISGGIDLSVGSTMLISAMVTAILMHAGWPLAIAFPAAMAASLLVGLINGVLIAIVGMPPFVVTLGMMSVGRSVGLVMSNNTLIFDFGPDQALLLAAGGGSIPIFGFPVPNPLTVMMVLVLLTAFLLRWTKWGRHVYAIGGNEKAAVLTGIPVRLVKISVYMFVGLFAGIAGFLQAGWLGSVTTGLGQGMELTVIAAAVIGGANLVGGIGTALGAVVGASLIEVIRNSLILLGISPFWQGTFVGTFIVLAVAFDRLRNQDIGE